MSAANVMPAPLPGLLDKQRYIAHPGFSRWLVPPCALAIHLCIGMAYGFSVFWLPMSKLIPGAPVCAHGFVSELFASDCNWSVADVTALTAARRPRTSIRGLPQALGAAAQAHGDSRRLRRAARWGFGRSPQPTSCPASERCAQ